MTKGQVNSFKERVPGREGVTKVGRSSGEKDTEPIKEKTVARVPVKSGT